MADEENKEDDRSWGIFLIPRDKAPDEGFMLTYGTHGGHIPTTEKGHAKAKWRAWWLPLKLTKTNHGKVLAPGGKSYRDSKDIHVLIQELVDDHVA